MLATESPKQKSFELINEKLKNATAVVMTVHEFKDSIRKGKKYTVNDIDVVTTATMGCMSGTAAIFVVPVSGAGVFKRAEKIFLNGVPGAPGPAPNERLGIVDCVVHGTAHSIYDHRYGGGHLFYDLVKRLPIKVEVHADDGRIFTNTITLDDMNFARYYTFRNCYKNYNSFTNIKTGDTYPSIFSFRPMEPDWGLTVVGSGEMNPLENDPKRRFIRAGRKILLNNASGMIVGTGTRATAYKPTLSLTADMFEMDPEYMGGFVTSGGLECVTSVAFPIPVIDEEVLEDLMASLDENIPAPIADVSDRNPFTKATYADIWQGHDLDITYDENDCINCSFGCIAEHYCPAGAISWREKEHDESKCARCGACTVNCMGGAFKANLGKVNVDGKEIPIVYRMGNRFKAQKLAEILKEKVLSGEFIMQSVDDILTNIKE
ncbi:MAG: methanogenesis marker 16 metalloprotein [Dehalobacterium sp.]